jgi:SH3-like domain-containing protein
VRAAPGLEAGIAFTLDAGAQVVGQSYTSQWVRIVDADGREGWIFHTLVSSR